MCMWSDHLVSERLRLMPTHVLLEHIKSECKYETCAIMTV